MGTSRSAWLSSQVLNDLARGLKPHVIAVKYGISVRTVYRIRQEVSREELDTPRPTLKPCGTTAAYVRHRRNGEVCPACWEAHARHQKEWARKRKQESQGND